VTDAFDIDSSFKLMALSAGHVRALIACPTCGCGRFSAVEAAVQLHVEV
jgi:hypothetical protein